MTFTFLTSPNPNIHNNYQTIIHFVFTGVASIQLVMIMVQKVFIFGLLIHLISLSNVMRDQRLLFVSR